MYRSMKIRLKPTEDQEILFKKSCGVARYAYNWGLNHWLVLYNNGEKPNHLRVRTDFNKYKKDLDWVYEVSQHVTAQSFVDLEQHFKNYYRGQSLKPKRKPKNSKLSFAVRGKTLKFKNDFVYFEKIGYIKFKTDYTIPMVQNYINPRCSFDGKYWYLSFTYIDSPNTPTPKSEIVMGIDLGIHRLAVTNIKDLYAENINGSPNVIALEKQLKRLQRQCSKKYEMNKSSEGYKPTKNIIKIEKKINRVFRKLRNIRLNHIHQTTARFIKTNPKAIVMEDLDIHNLMKNKYRAKQLKDQMLHEVRRQMTYKSNYNNIGFKVADRFYPSTKRCSQCGVVKRKLGENVRIFKCNYCGLEIDRDYNAAINLATLYVEDNKVKD